jgi:hypothetical protein
MRKLLTNEKHSMMICLGKTVILAPCALKRAMDVESFRDQE